MSAYLGLYGSVFLLDALTVIIIIIVWVINLAVSNPIPMHVAFVVVYWRVQKEYGHDKYIIESLITLHPYFPHVHHE